MAGNGRKFNRKDQELALALASGRNIGDAAQHAGLSPRTAHRRLRDGEFCRLVQTTRAELMASAVGRLAAGAGAAAETLVTLAGAAAAESVKLNAAKTVLELAARWRQTEEFEQRLSEMEKKLWNRNNSNG